MSSSHFDAIAAEYDESLPAHVVEHYLRQAAAPSCSTHCPPGRALDVGCGTGVLAARLAGAGYEMTGVDPSRGDARVLRARTPAVVAVAGVGHRAAVRGRQLRPRPERGDVAPHRRPGRGAPHARGDGPRHARPGGRILVWDHNPRNPYWRLLMARVPQDTGEERLIPEDEVLDGLRGGGRRDRASDQLGLVPDFVPRARAAAPRRRRARRRADAADPAGSAPTTSCLPRSPARSLRSPPMGLFKRKAARDRGRRAARPGAGEHRGASSGRDSPPVRGEPRTSRPRGGATAAAPPARRRAAPARRRRRASPRTPPPTRPGCPRPVGCPRSPPPTSRPGCCAPGSSATAACWCAVWSTA